MYEGDIYDMAELSGLCTFAHECHLFLQHGDSDYGRSYRPIRVSTNVGKPRRNVAAVAAG